MQKIFTIGLPKHLCRFTEHLFEGYQQPFPVDERTLIGKFIFSILSDKRGHPHEIDDDEWSELEEVSFCLSDTLAKRSASDFKMLRLERYLEEQFKHHLFTWVQAQEQLGLNRYRSLDSFLTSMKCNSPLMMDRYYQCVKRKNKQIYEKETNKLEEG